MEGKGGEGRGKGKDREGEGQRGDFDPQSKNSSHAAAGFRARGGATLAIIGVSC